MSQLFLHQGLLGLAVQFPAHPLRFGIGIGGLDRYRGEAALYTWFCQICRHALIDYCRARRRAAREE